MRVAELGYPGGIPPWSRTKRNLKVRVPTAPLSGVALHQEPHFDKHIHETIKSDI